MNIHSPIKISKMKLDCPKIIQVIPKYYISIGLNHFLNIPKLGINSKPALHTGGVQIRPNKKYMCSCLNLLVKPRLFSAFLEKYFMHFERLSKCIKLYFFS